MGSFWQDSCPSAISTTKAVLRKEGIHFLFGCISVQDIHYGYLFHRGSFNTNLFRRLPFRHVSQHVSRGNFRDLALAGQEGLGCFDECIPGTLRIFVASLSNHLCDRQHLRAEVYVRNSTEFALDAFNFAISNIRLTFRFYHPPLLPSYLKHLA